jgi:NADH-quinone oxidoreductase subunit A
MRDYFPLFLYILLGVGNALLILVASALMGPRRRSKNKFQVYECGLRPKKDARQKFNVNFYLTAVIFLLFDMEMVFLLPWASAYDRQISLFPEASIFRVAEVGLFMFLLALGLIFVYRRKALEWD